MQGKLALEHMGNGGWAHGEPMGKFCVLFTDNAHIKEHRRNQIISIMTSAIYQEQRKLLPALRHAFFGRWIMVQKPVNWRMQIVAWFV